VSVDRLLTDLYEGAPPPSALSGLQAVRLTEQCSRAQERRAELALTAQGGAAVVAELEGPGAPAPGARGELARGVRAVRPDHREQLARVADSCGIGPSD
jgi:hypothetical protein